MAKRKIVLEEEERRELNRRLRASTVSVRIDNAHKSFCWRLRHTQEAIGAKAGVNV